MHAAQGQTRPPTPSALTPERPLAIHFACHLVALGLLAGAVLLESALLARIGALVGLAGAVAFGAFFLVAVRRMARSGMSPARSSAG
jgi:hypothetical protein